LDFGKTFQESSLPTTTLLDCLSPEWWAKHPCSFQTTNRQNDGSLPSGGTPSLAATLHLLIFDSPELTEDDTPKLNGETQVWCLGKKGASRGAFSTLSTSPCPSDEKESSELLSVLETPTDYLERNPEQTLHDFWAYLEQFYLSQEACRGILRRAAKRGKKLPDLLKEALEEIAQITYEDLKLQEGLTLVDVMVVSDDEMTKNEKNQTIAEVLKDLPLFSGVET
jgi:hypothetical protein